MGGGKERNRIGERGIRGKRERMRRGEGMNGRGRGGE